MFGFAEMPNKEEADKATSGLNGKDLKGRPLTVNEARPRTDRLRTRGGYIFAPAHHIHVYTPSLNIAAFYEAALAGGDI
jgi:hypothetical protein